MSTLGKFVLCLLVWSVSSQAASRVIGGIPVPKSRYREIVTVKTSGGTCTGTIIGPRVVLVSAHCGQNGSRSEIKVGSTSYEGVVVQSHLYPGKDHDLAVVISEKEFTGVIPVPIGTAAKVGDVVTFFGYGCTQAGGNGGMDGKLRMGWSEVKEFINFDFVAKGNALCFGDSGGPAYGMDSETMWVVGVGSKGNIETTNYFTNTSSDDSRDFFKKVANEHKVSICGINDIC